LFPLIQEKGIELRNRTTELVEELDEPVPDRRNNKSGAGTSMNTKKKEKSMGRKGVSERKPKKSRPFSSADISGSTNARSIERSSIQSLVKEKGSLLNSDNTNPYTVSNKTQKKP
jgi:hypothetical protein